MTDVLDQFSLLDPARAQEELNAALKISGSLTVTDGSHTVAGTTHLAVTGGAVGGTSPNATLTVSGGGGRTILTADTTFYVATTGSDSTGDGTVGKPWATIQHAVDYVVNSLDCNSNQVTIQVADGTYPEFVVCGAGLNSGNNATDNQDPPFILQGNVADNTKVVIKPTGSTGPVLSTTGKAAWWHRYLTLDGTNVTGQNALAYTTENSWVYFDHCNFGNMPGGWLVYVDTLSFVHLLGGITIVATDAAGICRGDYFATILSDQDITISSALVCTDSIFYATQSSWVLIVHQNITVSGSVTGKRFEAIGGSLVTDAGYAAGDADALPGSISGTVDNTSWFSGKKGALTKAGLPATTDIPVGTYDVMKDTSGGGVYLAYNDAGTIKKVALT